MTETRFKDTEIGLIPEEWEVVKLGGIAYFSKGEGISRAESSTGNIPAIRYGEIYTVHDNYIKDFHSFISKEVAAKSKRLKYGDILFTASGETKEDIAKAVAFVSEEEAYAGGDIIIMSPYKEMDSICLGFLLNTGNVVKQRAAKAQGDAVVHITTNSVASFTIPLPSLPEQRRIAQALTSVDDLISSLSKLIEKKKNIKQGAMQQLLTGKKRLKGFNEPWVEKKLGEILSYEQPTQYLVSSTDYYDKGIPVLTAGKTFILGYTHEDYGVYTSLPVIIFDDFVTESKFVNFPFKAKSSAMKMLRPKNDADFDLRFVFEVMQTIQYTVGDHKRHWITEYSEIPILIPSTLPEQRAISAVLTNMDDEIAALEAKKAKYEAVKQGMMQQLLTGKIRLAQ